MNNLNALILGQTGAGKTSLAKYLAKFTPRGFFFDPRDDYDHAPAYYNFQQAAAFYVENHARDFQLVYRGEQKTYVAWLDILFRTQRRYTDPPLAVFLEESSLYSSSHQIDDYLERIYTQGRRQRISIITVVQRDTQIHPIIRAQAHVWISLRQRKFSTDVKDVFPKEDLERMAHLQTYTPASGAPVEGKHYVIDPPGFPLVEAWRNILHSGAKSVTHIGQGKPRSKGGDA